MSNPFVPILIMLGVALAMALGGLAASAVIGPKVMNRVKLADYECGVEPTPHRCLWVMWGRWLLVRCWE